MQIRDVSNKSKKAKEKKTFQKMFSAFLSIQSPAKQRQGERHLVQK